LTSLGTALAKEWKSEEKKKFEDGGKERGVVRPTAHDVKWRGRGEHFWQLSGTGE